jgi:hypothetical protein
MHYFPNEIQSMNQQTVVRGLWNKLNHLAPVKSEEQMPTAKRGVALQVILSITANDCH